MHLSYAAAFLQSAAAQQLADSVYIALLERTNRQMESSWTPIGIGFSALAVAVAVVSLIAAWAFFFQGLEYKRKLTRELAKFKSVLDAELDRHRKALDVLVKDRAGQIAALIEELNDAGRSAREQQRILDQVAAGTSTVATLRGYGFPFEEPVGGDVPPAS